MVLRISESEITFEACSPEDLRLVPGAYHEKVMGWMSKEAVTVEKLVRMAFPLGIVVYKNGLFDCMGKKRVLLIKAMFPVSSRRGGNPHMFFEEMLKRVRAVSLELRGEGIVVALSSRSFSTFPFLSRLGFNFLGSYSSAGSSSQSVIYFKDFFLPPSAEVTAAFLAARKARTKRARVEEPRQLRQGARVRIFLPALRLTMLPSLPRVFAPPLSHTASMSEKSDSSFQETDLASTGTP